MGVVVFFFVCVSVGFPRFCCGERKVYSWILMLGMLGGWAVFECYPLAVGKESSLILMLLIGVCCFSWAGK